MGDGKTLYIGTSGFSFPDWIGTVYPQDIKKSEMFDYYVKNWRFNALEVNFTYYAFPGQKSIYSLLRRSPENFCFVFKAPQEITHKFWRESDFKNLKILAKDFSDVLKMVKETKKLGGILLQFPYSFKRSIENFKYLHFVKEAFDESIELFVEFRNYSWAKLDTFKFLKESALSYVIVDEPKLRGLFPYIPKSTTEIVYFRFHGRNPNWFEAKGSERYNYLYNEDELKQFVKDIKRLSKNSKKTFVFLNNCHNGSAVKNALEFLRFLEN